MVIRVLRLEYRAQRPTRHERGQHDAEAAIVVGAPPLGHDPHPTIEDARIDTAKIGLDLQRGSHTGIVQSNDAAERRVGLEFEGIRPARSLARSVESHRVGDPQQRA